MKKLKLMIAGLAMALMAHTPVLAAAHVDTSRTYTSGLLIGLFLGFCALIVVVQLVPSIMMLVAFIRESLAKRQPKHKRQGVGVR
jgi:hypothetical protein